MNIKIAVCEDCEKDAALLRELCFRYCCETGTPPYEMDVFPNGLTFLEHCVPGSYDMVFMDIYLEQEDGMQVIRELRKTDKDCPVVFFTRSTDHAVEAFEVNAVHYLTKPLVYEKLADALSRCEKLHEKQAAFLLLPTEKKLRKVRLAEILYIEVFDNTCVIHLDGETIPVRIPLKNLETKIREVDAHSDFLRCHRSYLVNMNWIMALRNDYFLLDTGASVPISKYIRKQVVQTYENFAIKKIRDTRGADQVSEGGH